MSRGPVSRGRWRLAAVLLATGPASACTLPLTTQTLTGGALNAGAVLFVDRYNDEGFEGRGAYRYEADASVDTLAAIFEAAIARANRSYLHRSTTRHAPPSTGRSGSSAEDGVVLARAPGGRRARREDPPARETFPRRQWTPSPRYSIRAGSPVVNGDTLSWVVTHRSARQVAFLLVRRGGGVAATVAILPYDPPNDVFLSVPSDHAQRNAVETLHETFFFAVADHLGPEVLTSAFAGAGP